MPDRFTARYTVFFAGLVAVVCSVFVASSVFFLRPLQAENKRFDRMRNVLLAAGLVDPADLPPRPELEAVFRRRIQPAIVDLQTGEIRADQDPLTYDQRRAASNPELSRPVEENPAKVRRVPRAGTVFFVLAGGSDETVEALVVPVQGAGLWGQIYGYLALDADTRTIRGVSFYEHQETPGLGAEIENDRWTAQWVGRQVVDERGQLRFELFKGDVGGVDEDPYRVDALTGATITSKGVTALVRFWVGADGYGPFLNRFRESQRIP